MRCLYLLVALLWPGTFVSLHSQTGKVAPFTGEPIAADADASDPSTSQIVTFVGAWRREEDVPTLRALLDHPDYRASQVSSSKEPIKYEARDSRVRRAARDVLAGTGAWWWWRRGIRNSGF
jgi:hypothetical protein